MNDLDGHGLLMEHYCLNFEFLFVLNHDDVAWDYTKKEDMGKKRDDS
jgi:hypothetical protein